MAQIATAGPSFPWPRSLVGQQAVFARSAGCLVRPGCRGLPRGKLRKAPQSQAAPDPGELGRKREPRVSRPKRDCKKGGVGAMEIALRLVRTLFITRNLMLESAFEILVTIFSSVVISGLEPCSGRLLQVHVQPAPTFLMEANAPPPHQAAFATDALFIACK